MNARLYIIKANEFINNDEDYQDAESNLTSDSGNA